MSFYFDVILIQRRKCDLAFLDDYSYHRGNNTRVYNNRKDNLVAKYTFNLVGKIFERDREKWIISKNGIKFT